MLHDHVQLVPGGPLEKDENQKTQSGDEEWPLVSDAFSISGGVFYIFIEGFNGLQIHHRVVHGENSWETKDKERYKILTRD